jgi:zinc transporter 1/2/3
VVNKTPFNGDFQPGNPDHECDNQNCVVTSPPSKHIDTMPGIVLTCALVIHSILEGVAAGIISSESNLVILCIAILVHNIPAAFSLGVKITGLTTFWKTFLMLCFISSSPLGIAIGIGISTLNCPIVQAIFLSLSAGTFIYIGCTEILPEQFHEKSNKWLKFTGFLTGFVPLAILSCLVHE